MTMPENPPPNTAFDVVAESLDRNTASMDRASGLLAKNQRRVDFLVLLSVIEFTLVVVSVITVFFTLNTANDTSKLVRYFQQATSPAAQAKQAGVISRAISNITLCVENHSTRLSEHSAHAAFLDPIPVGCPPDDLKSSSG